MFASWVYPASAVSVSTEYFCNWDPRLSLFMASIESEGLQLSLILLDASANFYLVVYPK